MKQPIDDLQRLDSVSKKYDELVDSIPTGAKDNKRLLAMALLQNIDKVHSINEEILDSTMHRVSKEDRENYLKSIKYMAPEDKVEDAWSLLFGKLSGKSDLVDFLVISAVFPVLEEVIKEYQCSVNTLQK